MKQLFSATFLIGVVAGLPSTGCLVTNEDHCSLNQNSCDPGYICSNCVRDNNGCVPRSTDLDTIAAKLKFKPGECGVNEGETSSGGETSDTTSGTTGTTSDTTNPTTDGDTSSSGTSSTSEDNTSETSSTNPATTDMPSICGDGNVDEGEECDDGNKDNSDACLESCKLGSCGDGYLQPELGEVCDSVDGLSCDVDCQWVQRIVFVSSSTVGGKLGGILGADEICQGLAQAAGFKDPKFFKAWISDGNTSVLQRFDISFKGEYVLPNGEILATSWKDLVDGTLMSPIHLDESGKEVDGVVWTYTLPTGSNANSQDFCSAWTSSQNAQSGQVGSTTETDARWTQSPPAQVCASPAHLYCFEDVALI